MATEKCQTYRGGVLISETDVPISDAEANEAALRQAARHALATNRTFIANASPSNAQTVAEVKALARQVNALIRLELNQLDATD